MLAKAKHLESDKVNFYRADSLKISSSVPLNCNLDGEIIRDTRFDFSLEQGALNIDIKNSDRINQFLKTKKIIK